MKQFDLIIVGAGPGGLGACLQAATRGLKTALIERRSILSPLTRSCSEGILYEEEYGGDAVDIDREQRRIRFRSADFSLQYSGPVRYAPAFINLSPAGKPMRIVRFDGKPVHIVVDKAMMLEENLAAVCTAGVDFFPGHTVLSVENEPDAVTVHTDRQSFSGRFLIASDGHNSLCARSIDLNRDRTFYGTMMTACWHIEGFEPPEPCHMHLLEGAGGPAMICFCPRVYDGQYNVVLGDFNPATDFDALFSRIQSSSYLSRFFTGSFAVRHKLACILNLFSPLTDPCRGSTFVIGDAAWMGQTSNTHAALCGYHAVEAIHTALQNGLTGDAVFVPYRTWWQKSYVNHMMIPGANMFELLNGSELDTLFAALPDSISGSLEPHAARDYMGRFFQQFLPKLGITHPALVQKIAAIQQLDKESAWEDKRKLGFPVRKTVPLD